MRNCWSKYIKESANSLVITITYLTGIFPHALFALSHTDTRKCTYYAIINLRLDFSELVYILINHMTLVVIPTIDTVSRKSINTE